MTLVVFTKPSQSSRLSKPGRLFGFETPIAISLTLQAELDTLQLFQAAQPVRDALNCKPLILSIEEIEQQLLKTRVHKAVAPGTPPAAMIHALVPKLTAWAHHFIADRWRSQPRVPQCWKGAKLAFLAKRTVHSPHGLRPIALTDAGGKAVLGAYMLRAKEAMLPTLTALPLFA